MTYTSSDGTIKTHELIILSDVKEIKCCDIKDEDPIQNKLVMGGDTQDYMQRYEEIGYVVINSSLMNDWGLINVDGRLKSNKCLEEA